MVNILQKREAQGAQVTYTVSVVAGRRAQTLIQGA